MRSTITPRKNKLPNQPVRVLHVVGSMERGGVESELMSLLRKSDRQVLKMDFCVLSGSKGAYAKEIYSIGSQVIPCRIRPLASFKKRLQEIMRAGGYRALHSHVWSFSGLILKIAHGCDIPVRVAHSHNSQSRYADTLYRRAYNCFMRKLIKKYATHCLACAKKAGQALYGNFWPDMPGADLLYCSINVDNFHPSKAGKVNKKHYGMKFEDVVVGNVGNLREQKNYTFFLDIAAEFLKLQPDTFFFIAGEGKLRGQLEKKADRLGIAEKINFAGARDDVPELMMDVFDVLLFPSLYEGMPHALIEAAAAGLPVVCSDTITTEVTNVLPQCFQRLSLDDPAKQWAKAVKQAVDSGRVDNTKAFNAIKASHFSVDYSLKKLLDIYKI